MTRRPRPARRSRTPHPSLTGRRPTGDAGVTLAELTVAMSVFVLVVALFLGGVVDLTRSAVRSQNEADAAGDLRHTFAQVDRTARYADAVNQPGVTSAGTWYVEARSSTRRGEPPVCSQWRWVPTTSHLEVRTWAEAGGVTAATPWQVLATTVVGPTTSPPFTVTPANLGSGRVRQTLTLDLVAAKGSGASRAEARVTTSFVARNSSPSSPGNTITPASAGSSAPLSETPVCGALATTRP